MSKRKLEFPPCVFKNPPVPTACTFSTDAGCNACSGWKPLLCVLNEQRRVITDEGKARLRELWNDELNHLRRMK